MMHIILLLLLLLLLLLHHRSEDTFIIRLMMHILLLLLLLLLLLHRSEGISYGSQLDKLGWNSQPTAPVILENCKVPKENMLGMVGMGFKIAMQGLDGGRINIGTTALGGAAECLELAADHISSRKQFGRTLDQFQYLRFKIADMATELTAARLLVFQAAEMYDEKHPARTMHCAMAKRFATDVGFNICNNSLQMYYISIDFVLVVSEQIIQNY
mmetsp:Transcript_41432/g.66634  ORF Transcript_41432/g.66634 Transcript_41432/m.66634 type:complete len:214 (+) Transcript_41432:1213-1854(+)